MTAPPMTPTPEQVEEWRDRAETHASASVSLVEFTGAWLVTRDQHLATLAAAWGAKQEREACREVVEGKFAMVSKANGDDLAIARECGYDDGVYAVLEAILARDAAEG